MLGLPWLESLAHANGEKNARPAKRMAFYYPQWHHAPRVFPAKATARCRSLPGKTTCGGRGDVPVGSTSSTTPKASR